ncbi:hypothetical protein AXF42_Ash019085 [Apostasia shenzhenica]|uniref:EF-hand domain-containing protein n=1 Tax=Apostasia shenzhenica TaxID=1088818 RepID=A0A2I0BB99_9ASPA|nr:hypothetical protein AXF42_Ash019085 [Apostasia shenzhenica]
MCPSGRHLRRDHAAGSPDIRPAFEILDSDRDGRISRDDLRTFYSCRCSGGIASDDDISAMMAAADADLSGFVEFEEFQSVILGGRGIRGGIMEEAFRLMDSDGDGRVGFEDLKAYLGWAGIPVRDEEVREMIRAGGVDESAGVGFDDLLRLLAVDLN